MTIITLNRLLFHSSRKLSIDYVCSIILDICLIFASTIPEKKPAASRGWIVVNGATINAVIAEYIFEPDNIQPKNEKLPVININFIMLVSIFIPSIRANTNMLI